MPSTRRSILYLSGALILPVAGCSRIDTAASPTVICAVILNNHTDERVEGSIRVLESGRILADRTESLAPYDPEKTDIPGIGLVDSLPDSPGHYSVEMRVDDGPWDSLETRDVAQETINVFGRIDIASDSGRPAVSIEPGIRPDIDC